MQSILNPGLLLLQFCFGPRPDVNLSHTAGQFGQTLLQLLSVVIGIGGSNLSANLLDTSLDLGGGSSALHDGALVGTDHDLFGPAKSSNFDFLKLHAKIFHHGFTAGQHGDVLEHCFAAIAVSRRLDGRDLQHTTQLVDDQRRQGFTGDVFRDDQERLLGLHGFFKQWHQGLDRIDFVFVNQNQRLVQNDLHFFGVRHEVGGEEATIKLHAFDDINPSLEALPFFNRDHPIFADLGQRIRHDLADGSVIVGTDGGDRSHIVAHRSGLTSNFVDHSVGSLVHATNQGVGINTGGQLTQACLEQGLGQHGCRGGAVSRIFTGLGSGFANHASAEIFDFVGQFDLFGNRDTILGDGRPAPGLVQNSVSTSRAKSAFDGGGQLLNASKQ